MDRGELQQLLYDGLGEALAPFGGFRLRKSEEAFWRRVADGRQKLYVPVRDYRPEFEVSLTVGIRIDAVEDVFNLFSGAVGKDRELTVTTITPLDYFTGPGGGELRVSDRGQVATALVRLGSLIETEIVPFMDRHQDVHSIDRAMNVERRERFDITVLPSHAMHALIVAWLAGNPAYPELVAVYRERTAGLIQPLKDQLERLIAHLEGVPLGGG